MRIGTSPIAIKKAAAGWLNQGISPRRLAFTLAAGFAIGCIPVIGVPTVLCAALALALRLNLPAMQAANYAAMPLQLALIVPFVRFGRWLFASGTHPAAMPAAVSHPASLHLMTIMASLAGHALLAWLMTAIPAVLVMTAAFTPMLRRIPALAATESAA
jgi:uncharacterized protein (DUF2062 family)